MPPQNILNAPTKLMKDIGYGKDYQPTITMPTRAFRATITGPRKWSRRPITCPSNAGSNVRSPSGWNIGISCGGTARVSAPLDSFAKAFDYALTLPGTVETTSYGKPAAVIAANGHGFVYPGHEADTSFVVALDFGTVEMLMETEPETYWQSPHYRGYPAVLVRYDSADPERVRHVIRQAHEQAQAKPVKRKRAK